MITLGPKELAKAAFATLVASTLLHVAQQVIAGIAAAQAGVAS